MSQSPPLTQIVIGIAVVALLVFRLSRSQRISVPRMWITVALLLFVFAFAVYGYQVQYPAPAWEIGLAVVLGFAAGIPVGIFRGHHTVVNATDRHGVMQLGPSWITAAIYLVAFGGRALIRYLVPPTSMVGTVVGDGLLFFAMGIIAATYYQVYQKYQALDHATNADMV